MLCPNGKLCVLLFKAADEVDSVAMDDVYMTGIVRWIYPIYIQYIHIYISIYPYTYIVNYPYLNTLWGEYIQYPGEDSSILKEANNNISCAREGKSWKCLRSTSTSATLTKQSVFTFKSIIINLHFNFN